MHILLTNDDGIFAPGLAAIYRRLRTLGKVSIVAPSDVRSAAGHSISLEPVSCEKLDVMGQFEGYSVDGTPADCVKLALNELIDQVADPVDLIVSGINHGANLGIHVYYSGTVAAAMEGAFHGIPAVSLSAAFEEHMDMNAIADCCFETINRLIPLGSGNVISVNIPQLSQGKPKGFKVLPHAQSGFREGYSAKEGDNGLTVYAFEDGYPSSGNSQDDSDTAWLGKGYITVSALRLDMNDAERNEELRRIFQ